MSDGFRSFAARIASAASMPAWPSGTTGGFTAVFISSNSLPRSCTARSGFGSGRRPG